MRRHSIESESVSDGPGAGPGGSLGELLAGAYANSPTGLAICDVGLRLVRINPALERLLDVAADRAHGRPCGQLLAGAGDTRVDTLLRTVLETGTPAGTTVHRGGGLTAVDNWWALSCFRLTGLAGRALGVVCTLVDITEQHRDRERLALLHEAGTRIGSSLDVVRTAEELTEVAVPAVADFVAVDLLEDLTQGAEPVPGPLDGETVLLRRAALRSVTAGAPEATYPVGAVMAYQPASPYGRCLASGTPVLIPALQRDAAWLAQDPVRAAKILGAGVHSLITVPLRARDTTLGLAHFYRWSSPAPYLQPDLALVQDLAASAAVCIDNARRYSRERRTSLDLQHQLLHDTPLAPSALSTVRRQVVGGTAPGTGGSWCDVIPLSGARVALVAGDATGSGLQALTRAGRARTLVRGFSSLDLAPDELLHQLNHLVRRAMGASRAAGEDTTLTTTCLYLVYDPVTGRGTAASAGHPAPILVSPGRRPRPLDLPVGPPLGLGGPPAEAVEFDLPDNALLALYTDGLVGDDAGQHAQGLGRLLTALATSNLAPQELADAAIRGVVQGASPNKDAVLLLARARTLPEERVATWELPADPSIVSRARALATDQLAQWGTADLAPISELIVSELVTNAIRYGIPPIRLRLIRDRSLICEVTDSSSTSPHLRHAATTDEGGRGLFMIAQLADAWGTRYTGTNKTIWTEQVFAP